MEERNGRKGSIVIALLLIGVGIWYLAAQFSPQVRELAYGQNTWPYQIIGFGILLGVVGLFSWVPALLIPASIVSGIGGLLFWQNSTGNWESWAYAWTLIPGFVGIGLILFGLLARRRGALIGGMWNIFSSLVMFGIFGSVFGDLRIANQVWPAALILLGIFLLMQSVLRTRKSA
jgi:hypothetical protein